MVPNTGLYSPGVSILPLYDTHECSVVAPVVAMEVAGGERGSKRVRAVSGRRDVHSSGGLDDFGVGERETELCAW